MAADLPEPTPPVDTVAPQTYGPTVFNWTGAYIGANVGGAFGTGKPRPGHQPDHDLPVLG